MKISHQGSFDILLVEDSDEDIYLTKRAFQDSKLAVNLHITKDGEAALDFLYNRNEYVDSPKPDIILLDLNLPKIDGREVLTRIKRDDELKKIPIVILTTSQSTEDVIKSYNLHANSYIRKPVNFDKFTEIIKSIENFWLTVVRLPGEEK